MAFPLVSRSFFVTLSSITTSHEVFGCQSLMKNVAIVLLSMYSLLRNGVTLKSGIRKFAPSYQPFLDIAEGSAKLSSEKQIRKAVGGTGVWV